MRVNLRFSFQIRLLTIVSIVFLLSCKKKDGEPPLLSVHTPGNNTQYFVNQDFIHCSGTVSDNENIKRIEFQLQTNSGLGAMPRRVEFPNSNPYSFSFGYFLDDLHLESGNYKMKIEVFDEAGNSSSSYRDVVVYGVPRGKEGVFYIADNAGLFVLGKIDSLDQDSAIVAVFNDYGGFEINNYHQQIYYMGYESEDLMALNSNNFDLIWSVDNQANPPGTYYFHQLNFSSDKYLMVALYQNQVLSRAYNGTGAGAIDLNYINGQAETVFKDGNFVYVESVGIGTGIRRFQKYFFSSGSFDEEYTIDFDFKKILDKGNNELLILGDDTGQATMRIFYQNGGNYFQPLSLLPGTFVDAFKLSNDEFLIVQNNGVYRYTYSTSNLLTEISENDILSATYDDLNDQIYLGFSNLVKVYSSEGNFIRNIPVTGEIINLKVHYNK